MRALLQCLAAAKPHIVVLDDLHWADTAELFLSGKTIESHVRNAFHKLQVASRLELARLVDRAREQEA